MSGRFNKSYYDNEIMGTCTMKDLYPRTLNNLLDLEYLYNIKWQDNVKLLVAEGTRSDPPRTYMLEGKGPEDEEVFYIRRETAGIAAGQTFMIVDNSRVQVKFAIEEAPLDISLKELSIMFKFWRTAVGTKLLDCERGIRIKKRFPDEWKKWSDHVKLNMLAKRLQGSENKVIRRGIYNDE